jgi:hypothetical protein
MTTFIITFIAGIGFVSILSLATYGIIQVVLGT